MDFPSSSDRVEEHSASENGYKCVSTRLYYSLSLNMKAPPMEELKLSYRMFTQKLQLLPQFPQPVSDGCCGCPFDDVIPTCCHLSFHWKPRPRELSLLGTPADCLKGAPLVNACWGVLSAVDSALRPSAIYSFTLPYYMFNELTHPKPKIWLL